MYIRAVQLLHSLDYFCATNVDNALHAIFYGLLSPSYDRDTPSSRRQTQVALPVTRRVCVCVALRYR